MAGQATRESPGAGPGNRTIATTLLEMLAVRGRSAAVERARRALDRGAATPAAEAGPWLEAERLVRLLSAADVDEGLARALGHRVAGPDAAGLRLYGLGLATPEKAFRRIQSLLPRASREDRWEIDGIRSGRAVLRYRAVRADPDSPKTGPARAASPDRPLTAPPPRVERSLCALRVGMLEALPGLYGLLPARVRETACRARGAEACRYEVVWQRGSHAGLLAGGLVGVLAALAVSALAWAQPELADPFWAPLAAVLAAFAAPAFGRAVDLRRQLEAVAGARRGHLALFDQVDDELAAKLDALARVDASIEGGAPSRVVGGAREAFEDDRPAEARAQDPRTSTRADALDIHAAAGDLECWLDESSDRPGVAPDPAAVDARALVRDIRESAARLASPNAGGPDPIRRSVRIDTLVRRAVASARPGLGARARIVIEAEAGLAPVRCDPVRIEQVVVQLLRNAVEASRALAEAPEVRVDLRRVEGGVELAVEDRGVGLDSTAIDEVFDPFFAEGRSPGLPGNGLRGCLEIVERHGGALRIESAGRAGTRISVLLPAAEGAATEGAAAETRGEGVSRERPGGDEETGPVGRATAEASTAEASADGFARSERRAKRRRRRGRRARRGDRPAPGASKGTGRGDAGPKGGSGT